MWSSAAVLAGLTNSSTGLDDPESEDSEKLRGPRPPTPPPLLLQPEWVGVGCVSLSEFFYIAYLFIFITTEEAAQRQKGNVKKPSNRCTQSETVRVANGSKDIEEM